MFLIVIIELILIPGDRLFRCINAAIKEYMKRPIRFGAVVLISIILNFVTLGALIGAFLIVYYSLSLVGFGDVPSVVGVIGGTLLILYLVIMNGLKGALIKTLGGVAKREKPSIRSFFKYSIERGEVFFVITLLKFLILAILVAPFYLLYSQVLLPMELPYIDWLLYGIAGAIGFVVEIPFMYAYIAAANQNLNTTGALKASFRLLRKRFVGAFAMYTVYALVWVSLFIPLLNIITVFVFYPVIYVAAILFYEKYK